MVTAFSPGNSVSLTTNPHYWGPAPLIKNLLLLNQTPPTAKLTLEKGDTDIATALAPTQVASLKKNTNLTTYALSSPNMLFLLLNLDATISPATAKNDVRQAIRYALDYQGIVTLAGPGSIQAAGIVPVQYLGSLPTRLAPKQDVAKAKALLAKAGYANGFTASLEYPSDVALGGEDCALFGQKIQADLQAVGITINLTPKPIAVSLAEYRAGKNQLGFWVWGPDFPDPSDYLAFLPGQLVGLRANWKAGADPVLDQWMKRAQTTVDNKTRAAIYRQIQYRMNDTGPFIALFQPPLIMATQASVKGFQNYEFSPDLWLVSK
jgi:peptide/nickel transport system substrate-binding protein